MNLTIKKIQKWDKNQEVSKLINALKTEDEELRKTICLVLGKTKSADALLALRYISKNDKNEFVRITATKSISFMIDKVEFTQQIEHIPTNKKVYAELSYIPIGG